ncbi:MAG: cysteine--tRNA ligase [Acidobacteria bacterium]|nr:cysteine--tRNA ligase [Acidobacteriota bacterium]
MMLKLFNTLSRQQEEFQPQENNLVKMYNCGPTVYDFAHIGNFRTFLFVDVLRRYLKYKGYQLLHVMNITDIDDKTIKRANERGLSLQEHTKEFTSKFLEDFDTLAAERPEKIVVATQHIDDMIELIKHLDKNGLTYVSEGSVYYRISAFDSYGRLSGTKLSGNIAGKRVNVDEYDKEDARDFVLWKSAKADEPSWPTPYGEGRPGWHLECSAMSMRYLGESFDLHCGGVDLIFPHHENEIAQSEGATGKPFVKYWVHSEHLMVDGQKMSKRENRFFTVRDLIEQGFEPLAIRYSLISVSYRKQLNFTLEGLKGDEIRVKKLQDFQRRLHKTNCLPGSSSEVSYAIKKARQEFEAAMDDDLNTSSALAAVAIFESEINKAIASESLLADDKQAALDFIKGVEQVLGIFGEYKEEILDSDIQQLIEERLSARKNKNFARADEIRKYLAEKGIILQDTKDGTDWRRS